MDVLLVIGLAILCGQGGGKLLEKLKIPQVVGYILMGLCLGSSVSGVLSSDLVVNMTPITNFTLGIIGFMIGGELKKSVFQQFGKSIMAILLVEVFATFFLVAGAVYLYTNKIYLALIFGALSTATAPAATVDVLWEYKSKGPLTSTLLAIVGLDDALALIVYGFATSYAKTFFSDVPISTLQIITTPLIEIFGSMALGIMFGIGLAYLLKFIKDDKQFLPAIVASILIVTGLSAHFHLSQILANMFMGITLTNIKVGKSQRVFRVLSPLTAPIYILFFVIIGSKLNLALLPQMGLLGLIYILARICGKLFGANVGARIGGAKETVRKYLGLSLFSQAGIAIGLALAISQEFAKFNAKGEAVGLLVINVITATTFVVQMLGPPCVKVAITKAGEITTKNK